jgi:hypothetical protein
VSRRAAAIGNRTRFTELLHFDTSIPLKRFDRLDVHAPRSLLHHPE